MRDVHFFICDLTGVSLTDIGVTGALELELVVNVMNQGPWLLPCRKDDKVDKSMPKSDPEICRISHTPIALFFSCHCTIFATVVRKPNPAGHRSRPRPTTCPAPLFKTRVTKAWFTQASVTGSLRPVTICYTRPTGADLVLRQHLRSPDSASPETLLIFRQSSSGRQ